MPTVPSAHPTSESSSVNGPVKNQGRSLIRSRKLWVFIILLGSFCYLVNAPFARWLVLYGIDKDLSKQGMEGQARISGLLSSGFTVSQLSYTGAQGVQLLEIEEFTVSYRFSELFSRRIRSLKISGSKVVLDISRFPSTTKSKEKSDTQIADTLRALHPLVNQPKITISELELHLLKSGETQAQIHLAELSHSSQSDYFTIKGFMAADREQRTTPIHDIQIVFTENTLDLDRFEILPACAIENVTIDWAKRFKGEGELYVLDNKLKISASEILTAQLSGGTMDTAELNRRFGLSIPADLSITGADIVIGQWQGPIPDWDIDAALKLNSAQYQNFQLEQTTLRLKQKAQDYQLSVHGKLNSSPLQIQVNGSWLSPQSKNWWSHQVVDYHFNIQNLTELSQQFTELSSSIDLQSTIIDAKGQLSIKDDMLEDITFESRISPLLTGQTTLPLIELKAHYNHTGQSRAELTAQNKHGDTVLHIDTRYNLQTKDYIGKIKVNETNTDWINALGQVFKSPISVPPPLKLTWSGQGNASSLSDPHSQQHGELKINDLNLTVLDTPTFSIQSEIDYSWPKKAHVHSLILKEKNWQATAKFDWDGALINIPQIDITESGTPLLNLQGQLPYSAQIHSPAEFLNQTAPWNIYLQSQTVALSKLREFFSLKSFNELSGTTALNIQISGTPNQPEINGSLAAKNVRKIDNSKIAPLDFHADFQSKNNEFLVTSEILDGDKKRFTLKGNIPFRPSSCFTDPEFPKQLLNDAPLSAEIEINTLPLDFFNGFIPQLESLSGSLKGTAKLTGTINKPKYLIDIDADVPQLQTKKSTLRDIRNIKLNTKFTESKQAHTTLTAQINGGQFSAGGTINLTDIKQPQFDLYLRTKYALIHRDDMVSIRANSDIKLRGTIDAATLSGDIGLAESLFYKEIELIPIGVPSSEVAKVNMPALSKTKADTKLPVPEPFAAWKLNLTIHTDDPLLIRGNIASGNLTGSVKVSGTLAQPAPQGTIFVNRVQAKLPFSVLNIEKGEIKFTPKRGLDPELKIQGKSTIGAHDVNVFVYGSASSPKTTFTAYPPLPENEVMTLIATGTTTEGLENRSVAAFKAFQVFLLKWQQRNNKPGGNRLFKALIDGVDDLNLNVGETDPFTGRRFTSGTLEIQDHWNFTAQVDDTQQTRGLVVYVIRFR